MRPLASIRSGTGPRTVPCWCNQRILQALLIETTYVHLTPNRRGLLDCEKRLLCDRDRTIERWNPSRVLVKHNVLQRRFWFTIELYSCGDGPLPDSSVVPGTRAGVCLDKLGNRSRIPIQVFSSLVQQAVWNGFVDFFACVHALCCHDSESCYHFC